MGIGQLEIFFHDLNEEAQKEVLRLYDLECPEDGNFDTQPLFILEHEPEDDSSD